jgi:hypothetical protein
MLLGELGLHHAVEPQWGRVWVGAHVGRGHLHSAARTSSYRPLCVVVLLVLLLLSWVRLTLTLVLTPCTLLRLRRRRL